LVGAACSDTAPSVDVAEVPEGWDEHRRRQNVTVRDAEGGERELSPDDVALQAGQECAVQLSDLNGCNFAPFASNKLATLPFEPAECHVAACEATLRICASHRLMELAEHRDPEFQFGAYRYPVLDAAERATTHESALFAAREALLQTATALTSSLNYPSGCTTNSPIGVQFHATSATGEFTGTVLADAFVEAFHLTREAAERSFRSQLAVADGQRSLRRSDRSANTFAQLAPVLSRGAAAQLVTQAPIDFDSGADDFVLPILRGRPLADTRLRGERDELALEALREAAINPEDLMNDAFSIDELVGGNMGASGEHGSVLQRLEDLHGQDLGTNADDLYRNLRVTRDSFIHARDYLRGQVRAFARNPKVELAKRERPTDTGVHQSQYTRYAATASRPTSLPAAYWSTLASASRAAGLPEPSQDAEEIAVHATGLDYARSGLAAALDYAHSVATLLVVKLDSASTAVHARAFTTASSILDTANDERPARIVLEARPPLAPGYPAMMNVRALAMEDDDLVLLRGLDGATCAARGLVEGLPCDINDYVVPRAESGAVDAETGFQRFARWNVGPFIPPGAEPIDGEPPADEMFFLGRLRDVIARPGLIDILGGAHFPPDFEGTHLRPANPWLDAMAKEALEPNPTSPTDADTHCSGLPSDLDLPLENELNDDGDGIESSWRTYLRQAQIAAEEADRLGDELIRAGLEMDVRAEQALESLETTCGTAIDLDALAIDSDDIAALGTTCDVAADCPLEGSICHAGRCVMDPVAGLLAGEAEDDDSELARLRACVDEGNLVDFVSFGTEPLCLWVSNTNPNDVCNDSIDHPCPFKASMYSQDNCEGLAARVGVTAGFSLRAVDRSLRVFESEPVASDRPTSATLRSEICGAIRRLRVRQNVFDVIGVNSGRFFHPQGLRSAGAQLSAVAKLDGHVELKVGNQTWETGDAVQRRFSSSWPCTEINRPSVDGCETTSRSILCSPPIDCRNRAERTLFAERSLLAVMVAKSLAGTGFSGVIAPAFVAADECESENLMTIGSSLVSERRCGELREHPEWMSGVPGAGGVVDATAVTYRVMAGSEVSAWRDSAHVAFFDAGSVLRNVSPYDVWAGVQGLPVRVPAASHWFTCDDSGMVRPTISELMFARARVAESERVTSCGDSPVAGNRCGSCWVDLGGQRVHAPSHIQHPGYPAPIGWEGLDLGNVWDGVELLCSADISPRELSFGESCGVPPRVRTSSDLPQFRAYLGCLANDLRRRAEHMVIANVPDVVLEAVEDQSTGIGSYPAVGGDYGEHVAMLREGLRSLPLLSREVAGHVDSFRETLSTLESQLRSFGVREDILALDLASTVSAQITGCIVATANGSSGSTAAARVAGSVAATATCVNSGIQIAIAVQRRLAEEMLLNEQQAQVIASFMDGFYSTQLALGRTMTSIEQAQERIDSGLIGLETARRTASRSIAQALFADSDSAGRQYRVNTVMRRRLNTLQQRYEEARDLAVRRAELARRAIELRLAVDLGSMVEDMPLVEAPARWVNRLCEAEGIDYKRLRDAGVGEESYAPAYVGDYVRRLDAVVESYRLQRPFTDGRDTAVVSIKNEIDPIFAECDEEGPNLLFDTLDMTRPGSAWVVRDCPTVASGIVGQPPVIRDCVAVGSAPPDVPRVPWTADEADAPHPRAHRVVFGPRSGIARTDGLPLGSEVVNSQIAAINPTTSSLRHDAASGTFSRLTQDVELQPNRKYRLSWYERVISGPGGDVYAPSESNAVAILDLVNMVVPTVRTVTDEDVSGDGWVRRYLAFDTLDLEQPTVYEVAIAPYRDDTLEALFPQAIDIAGVMLEDVTRDVIPGLCDAYGCPAGSSVEPEAIPPREFWGTTATTANFGPRACEDTSGDVFRYLRNWQAGCDLPCDASASSCVPQRCYRELEFEISNAQERSGRLFRGAGFAHDNYNYRIERIGFNVVGTSVQDCEQSPLPTSCYASGFVGFDLTHDATTVLASDGGSYPTLGHLPLVPGGVRGGRALLAERQITNPLSGTDRSLVEPYMRAELRGRPLAGTYKLRIYTDDIVFDAIEDIQMVVDYRYWTPAE
jgi:hypothetical protein